MHAAEDAIMHGEAVTSRIMDTHASAHTAGSISHSSSSARSMGAMHMIPEDAVMHGLVPEPEGMTHGSEIEVDPEVLREVAGSALEPLHLPEAVSEALADVLPVLPIVEQHGVHAGPTQSDADHSDEGTDAGTVPASVE